MQVTWLGHASCIVQSGVEKLLVDPLGRARSVPQGPYTGIFITHSHIDHLNRWTLKALQQDCPIFVPKDAAPYVSDLKFSKIVELEIGDQISVGSLDVQAVATKHDGGRWKKSSHPKPMGYIFHKSGLVVHHAGDVDMSTYEIFEDLSREFNINTTLLPIGGMLPTWYYRRRQHAHDCGVHIDPDTAIEICNILDAQTMVPIHWGTVNLRLGRPSQPARRLQQVSLEKKFHRAKVLAHGESISLLTDRV